MSLSNQIKICFNMIMFDFLRATPKKRSVRLKGDSGIIFHNLSGVKKIIFNFGTVTLLGSLIFLVYLYQPLFNSWVNYKNISNNVVEEIKPINTLVPTHTPTKTPTPVVVENDQENILVEEVIEINNNFSINIPKIGARSDVISEVSPLDKKEYLKVLENNTIAHSNLSSLPNNGNGSMTYLFAHSTQQTVQMVRKNSVFYLLGELDEEDKIILNYRNQNIEYEVYMKKIITAKESEYLTYSDPEKEVLILQTCWPIGTNWKRLLVFAKRI